jgi:pimeloyl-ACP methyl ester carboxylesterase
MDSRRKDEKTMKLTEEIMERNGARIHYWISGKTGKPLVVFTHGVTIDHREWEVTLPLVGEQFRILTWDVRGHGLSRPSRYTLKDAEEDLLAILDSLQVEQAIFVGHSMGGNLHQELVFHHVIGIFQLKGGRTDFKNFSV